MVSGYKIIDSDGNLRGFIRFDSINWWIIVNENIEVQTTSELFKFALSKNTNAQNKAGYKSFITSYMEWVESQGSQFEALERTATAVMQVADNVK
jgi:hypothetical protein